jgi:hypothetical protein
MGETSSMPSNKKVKLSEETKEEMATDIAARYLKQAALKWAKEALNWVVDDDHRIAQVEAMLRAARHMCGTPIVDGDPIPSAWLLDIRARLIDRLISLMGPDKVLEADNPEDGKSPSKASKAVKAGRVARTEVKKLAAQVIRESEIAGEH